MRDRSGNCSKAVTGMKSTFLTTVDAVADLQHVMSGCQDDQVTRNIDCREPKPLRRDRER